MRIATEDPGTPDITALLTEHLADMHATSPAESVHALDLDGLRADHVTFWAARDDDGGLLGIGALAELSASHGELKSMRTARHARGRGVAGALVTHALAVARQRGYARVSIETGAEDYFAAARRLYARHGFVECAPFGTYTPDPHSRFFTIRVASTAPDSVAG